MRIFPVVCCVGFLASGANAADSSPAGRNADDRLASLHDGWIDFSKDGRKDIYEDPTATIDARINDLLPRLTLEEKCGQLAQFSGVWRNNGPRVAEGGEQDIRDGRAGSFLNVFGADITRDMQRIAVEESRLGIPLLFAHDVIHGFRTIFPVPLAEAASWDLAAVENAARVAAIEATAHGLHWTFAPMVDIARDARWGRIVEGAGEDVYLGSKMAAARVRGFQGTDLRDRDTLLACVKHFAAYGGAESGRDYNIVDVSERTLRETYLPPFKAAVDAGAATFMAAFNEVAGVPCHANAFLLRDVLRDAWHFDGLVVSDWEGIDEMQAHGVAATPADAGLLALGAGVDVDMVSGIYLRDLAAAVRAGRLSESVVDAAVRRVLHAKLKLGLLDDPYRYCDAEREKALTLTSEHRAAARAIAQKSIVLLKNASQTLPLSKQLHSLAVIGPLADDASTTLGSWSAAGQADEAVSILAGLRGAVGAQAKILHAQGAEVDSPDTTGFADAVRIAREADAVVLVLGESATMSGEARSRTSLDLPGVQNELAQAVRAATAGKPLVVVLMNGRPLSVGWLDENIPAILETWFLGSEMGSAVADVLFGEVNPSGKLPVTFPRTVGQVPIYYNFKNTGRPPDAQDEHTSKYIDAPWTPLYVFGHGLSYTTFAYRDLRLGKEKFVPGEDLKVEVNVTNTGQRAGVEVVQLYLQDEVGSVTRPVRELRGFSRVELAPGESRIVTFTLTSDDLACYDLEMKWSVEPGFFRVFVGGSSAATLSAKFEVVPGTKR
jgi:beta-glucosidase